MTDPRAERACHGQHRGLPYDLPPAGQRRSCSRPPRCVPSAETCGGPAPAAVCVGHQARHYGRHAPACGSGLDHHHPGAELQSERALEPHPGSGRDRPEGEIQKERCQKADGEFRLPLGPRRFGRRAGNSASREAAAKSPERPGNLPPGAQRKGLQSIFPASDRRPLASQSPFTSRQSRARTRACSEPPESTHRIRAGPVAKGGLPAGGHRLHEHQRLPFLPARRLANSGRRPAASAGGAGESSGLLVRALGPAFASACVRK